MSSRWRNVLGQGLVGGLIGFVTVAATLAIANVLAGRSPFHTAAVLGAAVFYGINDPSQVTVQPAYVFAYNGVHLATFVLFGLFGAWLADIADRGWQLWYVSLFFFIFAAFHLIAAVQLLASPMRSAIPDIAIWGAGIAASILMAAYLMKMHPRMRAAQAW